MTLLLPTAHAATAWPLGTACGDPHGCLAVQQTNPFNRALNPIDGVIVRWDVRGAGTFGIAPVTYTGTDGDDTVVRHAGTPLETATDGSTLTTFDVEPGIPIRAGDNVGLVEAQGARVATGTGIGGADLDLFQPLPALEQATEASSRDVEDSVDYTVWVQPDADHDGYGDNTQDGCPTDASTHGPCPAPPAPVGGTAPAPAPAPAPAAPAAPPKDTTPPALVGQAKLSATAFRARTGTTLRLRLSEPGRLVATVSRDVHGHARKLGTLVRKVTTTNMVSIPIRSSVGGHRLVAGRYTLRLTATDAAGNAMRATTLRFTVR